MPSTKIDPQPEGPALARRIIAEELAARVPAPVLDDGLGFATRGLREGPGGSGLQVVEQLSDRWGVEYSPQRTEVWFERHAA